MSIQTTVKECFSLDKFNDNLINLAIKRWMESLPLPEKGSYNAETGMVMIPLKDYANLYCAANDLETL